MVDKYFSPTPKMTVFDCLKPLTLSAVGNDNRMLRKKFVVVCKCPRDARGWNRHAHKIRTIFLMKSMKDTVLFTIDLVFMEHKNLEGRFG